MSLMDTAPSLNNYTGALTELPDEAFLGQLIFFSISAADVNLVTARQRLLDLDISIDGLRKTLRPVDAFHKAALEFATKFKAEGTLRHELLARSAGEDVDHAFRHIMLERKRTEEGRPRRLSYDKVAELTFTRGEKKNGAYTGFAVRGALTEANQHLLNEPTLHFLTDKLEKFEARFEHLRTHMDSHAVRTFVRHTIDQMSGTCVKSSGGLYFVPQIKRAEVERLGQWVNEIGSQFHVVPLLNLVEQRDMIMEAFEEDTIVELRRMIDDCADVLNDPERTIEQRTHDAMFDRAMELASRANDYAAMLGTRAEGTELEINIALAQIGALQKRVRQPKRPVRATKTS